MRGISGDVTSGVQVINTQGEPIRGSQMLHKCPLLGWSNINKTHHPKVKANGAVGIVNVAPLKFVLQRFLRVQHYYKVHRDLQKRIRTSDAIATVSITNHGMKAALSFGWFDHLNLFQITQCIYLYVFWNDFCFP